MISTPIAVLPFEEPWLLQAEAEITRLRQIISIINLSFISNLQKNTYYYYNTCTWYYVRKLESLQSLYNLFQWNLLGVIGNPVSCII